MAQDKPKPKKKKKTAVRSSKPLGSSPSMGPMAPVPAIVGLRTGSMLEKRALKAPSAAKKAYEKAKAKKK